MELQIDDAVVDYMEHGAGKPGLILHGADLDHRGAEARFEPALRARPDLRRIYPDLPGMGRTSAPSTLCSADDVLEMLLHFTDEVVGHEPILLVCHSVGAYYSQGLAVRRASRVAGLALVCPLLAGIRDVPDHRPVHAHRHVGDGEFRGNFVVHAPAMHERYQRFVAPATRSSMRTRWNESPDAGSSHRPPPGIHGPNAPGRRSTRFNGRVRRCGRPARPPPARNARGPGRR